MKKLLTACGLGLLLTATAAQAQTVVMQQDVNQDTLETSWGPNKRHHIQRYIGFGLGIGTEDRSFAGKELNDVKYGFGTGNIMLGMRYKFRLAEHYALGLDLGYNRQSYNFKQRDDKFFPAPGKFDKERLTLHNVALEAYQRINFGRRGNHLGKYLDMGAYGEWNFSNVHLIKDEVEDPLANGGARKIKAKYKNLTYLHNLNYGVSARLGFGRWVVFGRYRLSDMFAQNKLKQVLETTETYPELPRLTVGIQIGL